MEPRYPELLQAIQDEQADRVARLLADGSDANTVDETGRTALLWAAISGNGDVVRILLEYGANPNKTHLTGDDLALGMGAFLGHSAVVMRLIGAGADVNGTDKDGVTALMDAAKGEQIEVIRNLLDAGALVNRQDRKGYTALTWAAIRTDSAEVAKTLIKAGANPHLRTASGEMALSLALALGHGAVASEIANADGDVNDRTNEDV
jgi:ankyrin repeat protein